MHNKNAPNIFFDLMGGKMFKIKKERKNKIKNTFKKTKTFSPAPNNLKHYITYIKTFK